MREKESRYRGTIHIVYDGMWGSCGKGKFCGTLARDKRLNIQICVNNNAPNAGHTFVFDNGRKVVTKHIPIGFVNPDIPFLVIGESAIIDYDILVNEIETYKDLLNGRKLFIADSAAVILPEHKERELKERKNGSTFSGAGAALADKIARKNPLVRGDPRFAELAKAGYIKIVPSSTFFPCIYNGLAGFDGTENILVELSQGVALNVNGESYPYVTSRDCTPAQALKDIHATDYSANVRKYCVFRPYPIRINNEGKAGYIYTGDFEGASEITWQEVCARCGLDAEEIEKLEHTTVTHRLRRVSELSLQQFGKMLLDTQPDECFLNFAQYVDSGIEGLTTGSAKCIQSRFHDGDWIESVSWETQDIMYESQWAIEHVLGFIQDMEEYYESMVNFPILNVTRIGTGAKEREWINAYAVELDAFSPAAKDMNPLDYAFNDGQSYYGSELLDFSSFGDNDDEDGRY